MATLPSDEVIEHVEEVRCLRLQPGDMLLVKLADITAAKDVGQALHDALPVELRGKILVMTHDDSVEFEVVRAEPPDA